MAVNSNMNTTYGHVFLKNIVKNKTLMWAAALTAVLCFGFVITNHSIGVDDPLRNHYLFSHESGSLIQQGRLLPLLFNALTGMVDFIPFFNEFIAAALFLLSALLFAALFQYVAKGTLSTLSLTAFVCLYISYSIINEKFIYSLDVVPLMIAYCCIPLSLLCAYRFSQENRWRDMLVGTVLLMLALGSYESFLFLYFCGVFAVWLIQYGLSESKARFKPLLVSGLKYALIFVAAVVVYYAIVYGVQILTDQYDVWQRSNPWMYKDEFGNRGFTLQNASAVHQRIKDGIRKIDYLPILEFDIAVVVGGIVSLFLSVRKRSVYPMLFFIPFCLGNLVIHYISGFIMYRSAQTFCLFVAFTALLLLSQVEKIRKLRNVLALAVVFLVLIQSADLNRWFYHDQQRYEKESFAINAMATQLVAECDLSKPVVFVNAPSGGYLDEKLEWGSSVNGNSVIYWGVGAFGTGKMHEVFEACGYTFLKRPTEEVKALAKTASLEMPAWPTEGCIREFDGFIVVKMA